MAKIRTAVGIAVFRSNDSKGEVKEHLHSIFEEDILQRALEDPLSAKDLAENDCLAVHGVQGECVEFWGLLHQTLGKESNFTVYLPQDVRYRAPHLPDDLFMPS